jgi:hypothetical protein
VLPKCSRSIGITRPGLLFASDLHRASPCFASSSSMVIREKYYVNLSINRGHHRVALVLFYQLHYPITSISTSTLYAIHAIRTIRFILRGQGKSEKSHPNLKFHKQNHHRSRCPNLSMSRRVLIVCHILLIPSPTKLIYQMDILRSRRCFSLCRR